MNKPFQFKQFTIHQDQCAMKVGTDGVLLGAWVSIAHNPDSILDIGAGTGLLALQLAQRSQAMAVDAIEIDEKAFEQCVANFEASPWGDRLFCYHASWQEFYKEVDDSYDLIISNPPFHTEEVTSGSTARDNARQEIALPFEELLQGVRKLLSLKGIFALVLPFSAEANFRELALKEQLFATRILRVRGNAQAAVKRSLMEFSFEEKIPVEDELIIEKERHEYTSAYQVLTKDFYLKMDEL